MNSDAQIIIDDTLCTQPELCRKCLQVCQPCVLNLTFTDEDYHDPQNWMVIPAFPQLCLGPKCGQCIDVCPENAINIKFKL